MMKTSRNSVIVWLCMSIAIMFLLPFGMARFASECAGMALCMLLFFVVNPAYSIVLGLRCGRDFRHMWYMPLVSSVAFLVGSWVVFDIRETWFIVYAAVYLVVGMVAAAISACMVRQ